jgi:hypothetical protein
MDALLQCDCLVQHSRHGARQQDDDDFLNYDQMDGKTRYGDFLRYVGHLLGVLHVVAQTGDGEIRVQSYGFCLD